MPEQINNKGLHAEVSRAMAEWGRLGGLKGGPARMAKLTPQQRSEMGRRAMEKRWGKKRKSATVSKKVKP